ncbi:hypothetical protein ECMP02155212_5240 [Escherichia coli MP021552.12]|nr:hypothetical protein ECMP02155212_5240 [Escherichia coli MP021552.12]
MRILHPEQEPALQQAPVVFCIADQDAMVDAWWSGVLVFFLLLLYAA